MKYFIRNTTIFLVVLLLLLISIFSINTNSLSINLERDYDQNFFKKKRYFSKFINKNENINIVLGSSTMENGIIPDSLGPKWFSFSNRAQNIYESYKFIDYFQDSVKIDTIIIGLMPFDFNYTLSNPNVNFRLIKNGSFFIFGIDSITFSKGRILSIFQKVKEQNYPTFEKILRINNNDSGFKIFRDVYSSQGFSGDINRPSINLDLINNIKINDANKFFQGTKQIPNFYYFDLFNRLAELKKITVIYLITPATKYYYDDINAGGYSSTWNNILDTLIDVKHLKLWNYSYIDSFDLSYFLDKTHLSYNGAIVFTKMIRKRLQMID